MHPRIVRRPPHAFTLIELLVVITIIAILIGLFLPSLFSMYERAKKVQAKNDLTQIVNAANAFYTEYGKYPLPAGTVTDTTYGPGAGGSNKDLFYTLRAVALGANASNAINTRQIVFLSPKSGQRGGIATQNATINGISVVIDDFVDPWGIPYNVAIDGTYDNQLTNPYTADSGAGPSPLRIGVIAWSLGKDQAGGSGNKSAGNAADDVISWQ